MSRRAELVGVGRAVAWGDPAVTDLVGSGSFVLPTGTVAFLLTDIEGSTRAWESEPDAMHAAVDRHHQILDAAVSAHGGVRPPAQGEGDSIVAAFSRASDAVLTARDAQRALAAEDWPASAPLRVRMAVHSGEARFVDDGNYAGHAIIRTARLRAIAHGGQVLVSAPARDLTVDQLGDAVTFIDLGAHRLRDLARPERVYQLTDPAIPADFPALRSLDAHLHNLPVQLSSFIGRTDDIATVTSLVRANRLVTITGTGGAGKTRLALQAAAELVDHWPDGTWWVELAELTDSDAIVATIAAALRAMGYLATAVGLADPLGTEAVFEEAIQRLHKAGDRGGEVFIRSAHARSVLIILGDTRRGWRLHADVEPMVMATGNQRLAAIHHTTAAIGHCIQADYAAALHEVAAAEAALHLITDAADIDMALLMRRSLPGALASFAATWATGASGGLVDFDALERTIASARAEGFVFAEMVLGIVAGVSALLTLGADAAVERLEALAPRARELGLGVFWVLSTGTWAQAEYGRNNLVRADELLDGVDAVAAGWLHYQVARHRCCRGSIRLTQGNPGEAESLAHEALDVARCYTFRLEAAMSLELLASVATVSGSHTEGARLLGAASRLRDDFEIGIWFPGDKERALADHDTLKTSLGDEGYEAALAEGYALTLEEAAEYARRARGERKRPVLGWDSLTPTELQVVEQVSAGLTNPQIAEKLLMSRETVKTHLSHIFTKLGVRTRSELAVTAVTRT